MVIISGAYLLLFLLLRVFLFFLFGKYFIFLVFSENDDNNFDGSQFCVMIRFKLKGVTTILAVGGVFLGNTIHGLFWVF